jgi:hypothetical protein
MAYKLLDFADIYNAVAEELKIQTSDITNLNRIKRAINMIYIDEVIPASRWWWLVGHTSLTHRAYYANSTVSVTPNSSTVTLAVPPGTSDGDAGSLKGWLFSINGKNEIYRITAHTALSATFTIDRPFNNELDAAALYKIWPDFVSLPTDLRETQEVWHDHMRVPMVGRGLQEFRKLVAERQKADGRPGYYCTTDFEDPSSGDGEHESDRYRILKVYPAISQYKTLIKLDYIKEVDPLELDGDEPLMPVEDRIVLFYGALSLVWGSIGRNPEEAGRNRSLFDRKLALMLGRTSDSMDKPRFEPESRYVAARRGSRFGIKGAAAMSGGGSSVTTPTYLENVTINGATLTGNVTANPGITVDGRDISADGADLDTHIAATADVHGVGATADVVGTDTVQTLTNKDIDATLNTISNIEDANISATAAIAKSKLAAGTPDRVEVTNGSGELVEAPITYTELTYLDDVEALTTVTLTDNTAAQVAVSWPHATFSALVLDYSLSRGTSLECGTIHVITDGTTVGMAQSAAAIGIPSGVVLSVIINGANIEMLSDTTANTGSNASLKYKVNKWLA